MSPHEMNNERLVDAFKSAWNPQPFNDCSPDFEEMGRELLRRLNEADALREDRDRWKSAHERKREWIEDSIGRIQDALGGHSLTPSQPEADLDIIMRIKKIRAERDAARKEGLDLADMVQRLVAVGNCLCNAASDSTDNVNAISHTAECWERKTEAAKQLLSRRDERLESEASK